METFYYWGKLPAYLTNLMIMHSLLLHLKTKKKKNGVVRKQSNVVLPKRRKIISLFAIVCWPGKGLAIKTGLGRLDQEEED